ncbi:MAG: 2-deoxy-5-keto-D-gluconate 6-phosphate aldolase domain-containing protein, partial [Paracoccaceae bacterium]
ELTPSIVGAVDDTTTPILIQRFYDRGIYPDWWKLEPFTTQSAWSHAVAAIERNDPRTRGIVILGLDAAPDALAKSFALAAKQPLVKGFTVGRTIFGEAARQWMSGQIDDTAAVRTMAANYQSLCHVWDSARNAMGDAV